ncbi:MAG: 50S ribosomal protein L17 [Candidatus Gribaldobacteria bacterium]|nr:50S ribosomal protein L17 [Candidatus Gribaldobacteria bacterium]
MNKQKRGRKFSMESGPRKALMKTWVVSFVAKERIQTTEAKAKEFRRFIDRFITKAKKADLANRRYLLRFLTPLTVKKLIDVIAPRFQNRSGGFTRIMKLGQRKSDGAKMVIIELVEKSEKKKIIKKAKKEKK